MFDEIIYKYAPLWGSWEIVGLVGEGSIGKVYKVSKKLHNREQISAVKVITIPTKEQINTFTSTFGNYSNEQAESYYENFLDMMLIEIDNLNELNGHTNIINYYDCMIQKEENKSIWHIFIRMEYAENLQNYLKYNTNFNEDEVIKIGVDICNALIKCHNEKILHRDIKEANLFRTLKGVYKLGDFSISKNIGFSTSANTKIGTPSYIAPEVIQKGKHDNRADIYSLGIVLYKMLNNGRFPFMPKYPDNIIIQDIEYSNSIRLSGKEFNEPENGSFELKELILKACAFNPEDRFKNASEFKNKLESIKRSNRIFSINTGKYNKTLTFNKENSTSYDRTINLFNNDTLDNNKKGPNSANNNSPDDHDTLNTGKKKARKKYIILSSLLIGIIIIIFTIVLVNSYNYEPGKNETIAKKSFINTTTKIENPLLTVKETLQSILTPIKNSTEIKLSPSITANADKSPISKKQASTVKKIGSVSSNQSDANLIEDTQVHSVSPYAQNYNITPVCIGYGTITKINRVYLKLASLPELPSGAQITKAVINMCLSQPESNVAKINVHIVNSSWSSISVNWNNMPEYGSLLSSVNVSGSAGNKFQWTITSAVKNWYSGANYGLLFKNDDETRVFNSFHSGESPTISCRPQVIIYYEY